FSRANFVDELIGGVLGIVQGLIILGAVILILDSYFRLPVASVESGGELKFLRDFYDIYDKSGTGTLFRNSIIPAFLAIAGIFIPEDIRNLYPRLGVGK